MNPSLFLTKSTAQKSLCGDTEKGGRSKAMLRTVLKGGLDGPNYPSGPSARKPRKKGCSGENCTLPRTAAKTFYKTPTTTIMSNDMLFLKMLVILKRFPIATPSESVFYEKPVAQVVFRDLIWEYRVPGEICPCVRRLYQFPSRRTFLIIRVVKRIDVNS